MISSKFKCVFVHIPKTAGQSIETFFLNLHGLDWKGRSPLLLRCNPDPELGPERLAHLTASEYTSYGYLTDKQFSEYFKFAFVRNPWARLVSEFKFRNHPLKTSFKDFVTSGLPEKDSYSDGYRHIMPQYDYLYDNNGNLLVDFIGRFENLQNDFDDLCSRIGVKNSMLSHVNSSRGFKNRMKNILAKKPIQKMHYSSYYDDELKEIVGEIYQLDISAFGYKFDS